jgi:hypothetical protein
MICAELDFVTIGCCPSWEAHYPSIQYQKVQPIFLACEFSRRCLDAGKVCEIALYKFDGRFGNYGLNVL